MFIVIVIITIAGLVVLGILLVKQEKDIAGDTLKKLNAQRVENETILAEKGVLEAELNELKGEYEQLLSKNGEAKKAFKESVVDLIYSVKLKDIMSDKVYTIEEDAKFSRVPRIMKEFNIRHLPVVDHNNKLVGLITQRMMYKIKSPRKLIDGQWYYDEEMLDDVILKNVMVTDVYALDEHQSMGKALVKMVYSKFGCIPVVGYDNTVLGVVTRKDLLKVVSDYYQNK